MCTKFFLLFALVQLVASFIPRNGPCIPGELVWVECNLCTCTQRGMPNYICAKMWCQPQPKSKGMTTEAPDENEEDEFYDGVENNETI
ncbi:Hypothetical protein NTJ_08954 [Nesidiocoris tenuis]|uniref:Pacifastin domain-containing protein n=1 Tax=Nesidiocoris tenuis TaxID=355587 RepID=A0ABN7AVD1_9HEMI|nr:Hypothetical protein NTJ_08954 [Nesidiocoris tenuis]